MDNLFVMLPFLKGLTNPRLYRTVVAWVLRVAAVASPLALIFISVHLWQFLSGDLSVEMIVLGILSEIILAAFTYTVANILWFRAGLVAQKVDADDYPVTLIATDLVRLGGEVFAATLVFLGLTVFVAGMFPSSGEFIHMLAPMFPGEGFLGGLIGLVLSVVVAFVVLLLAYGLAELIRMLADIARNTKQSVAAPAKKPSLKVAKDAKEAKDSPKKAASRKKK